MGFEVLIYNGFLTFLGLWSVSAEKNSGLGINLWGSQAWFNTICISNPQKVLVESFSG
jgi:hypothetical protein